MPGLQITINNGLNVLCNHHVRSTLLTMQGYYLYSRYPGATAQPTTHEQRREAASRHHPAFLAHFLHGVYPHWNTGPSVSHPALEYWPLCITPRTAFTSQGSRSFFSTSLRVNRLPASKSVEKVLSLPFSFFLSLSLSLSQPARSRRGVLVQTKTKLRKPKRKLN